MSTPKDPKDPWNDEDMEALFNADQSSPSPAVDNAILSAAHGAVAKQKPRHKRDEKRWYSYWPQGLSVAAVVVLAVILVPLIVSTPESSLESSLASDEDLMLSDTASSKQAPTELTQAVDVAIESAAESIAEPEIATDTATDATAAFGSIAESTAAPAQNRVQARAASSALERRILDSQHALVSRLDGLTYQNALKPSWQLTFDGDSFTWDQQNRILKGTYQFVDKDTFRAQLLDRQFIVEFAGEGGLRWDGVEYRRAP